MASVMGLIVGGAVALLLMWLFPESSRITSLLEIKGERIDSAVVYKGTLSMFERRGFEAVARRQHNQASPVRPTVRLTL